MAFGNTFRAALHDGERYWAWKFALRVIAIIFALVAVGTLAWASTPRNMSFNEYFYLTPWEFFPLGISIIWNVANNITLFVRKRPVHPGANVGMDLVLWLGLIVTSSLAIVSATQELQWLPDDYDYDMTNSLNYIQLPNGTYGYVDGHYTEAPNGTEYFVTGNSSDPVACSAYESCAQEYRIGSRHHKLGIVLAVGVAFSFAVMLLHFALFVWACVDTHKRRSGNLDKRAQRLAQNIIAEMTERGVLPQPRERQQEEGLLAHDGNAGRDASVEPSRMSESRDPHALPMQGVDPYNGAPPAEAADQEGNLDLPSLPPRLAQMSGALGDDEIHPASALYHDTLRDDRELYE
ncbi:hypothetical protein MMC17_005772 [Xylographa soralifera]|nr:hypothetical protein [Xylographa soralifera]